MRGLGKLFIGICNGKNIERGIQSITRSVSSSVSGHSSVTNVLPNRTNCRSRILQVLGPNHPDLFDLSKKPQQFYTYIRDLFYKNIRGGGHKIYEQRPEYNPREFKEALFRKENGFYGKIENTWVYRYPDKMSGAGVTDRISLNVYQDKELIQKLDQYLSKNCPDAHYKCPGAGKIDWNRRHDVITIYFSGNLTKKISQDIAALAKPHIRINPNEVMIGEKITNGVYHVLEPTKETIRPLIIKAKLLNMEPEFYEWLGTPDFESGAGLFVINNGQRFVHSSPGLVESLSRMLNLFERILK